MILNQTEFCLVPNQSENGKLFIFDKNFCICIEAPSCQTCQFSRIPVTGFHESIRPEYKKKNLASRETKGAFKLRLKVLYIGQLSQLTIVALS